MTSPRDVRVDRNGTVVPVGGAASDDLRRRAGDWRLLSSPPEVLLAARPNARPLRLAGEVRTPGALCEVIAIIAQGGLGGELAVHAPEGERSLYFDRGNVVGASSQVDGERLGEILWRFGAISRDQHDELVASAQVTGKRVGEAAIDLRLLGPDELFHMMGRQVEEVFTAATQLAEGTFFLFDGLGDARIPRPHQLSTSHLLIEAARRMDELRFFREKVPSDAWVPSPIPQATGRVPPGQLASIYAKCDGRRSVAEIGRRVGLLEFDVTRAVFQLVTAGLVAVGPPRPEGAIAVVEVFDRALAAVHVACDAAGKGGELRAGIAQFAAGAGVHGPLLAAAGPRADGTLVAARVAQNLAAAAVPYDAQPEAWLVQQLFEYAGFALFHAGTLLPRGAEVKLAARVAEMLKPLRQQSEGARPPSQSYPPARRGPPPGR